MNGQKTLIKLIKENIEGELIDAKIYKDKFKEALENDMNTSDA